MRFAVGGAGRARHGSSSSARSRSASSTRRSSLGPLVGHAAARRARARRSARSSSTALFRVGGRLGFGPLAAPPGRDDPAALLDPPRPGRRTGWLRPGWALGIPIVWAAICLLAIPLGVYVVSLHPVGAAIENHQLVAGLARRPHRARRCST